MLLLKAKLLELSPEDSDEVLLKSQVLPVLADDGTVLFVGKGRTTVNVEEAIKRLDSLGVRADWKRIRDLTRHRNDIEHYAQRTSSDTLRSIAASVLVVVRDFAKALGRDPREMLGEETWKMLLENDEVFRAEHEDCLGLLGQVEWGSPALEASVDSFECSTCGSPLVVPIDPSADPQEMILSCRSCGDDITHEDFIPRALEIQFGFQNYVAIKDGGEAPIATCPQCALDAFVREEGRCAACGEGLLYSSCSRCNADLGIDEQDLGGLCGYCEHVMSKD